VNAIDILKNSSFVNQFVNPTSTAIYNPDRCIMGFFPIIQLRMKHQSTPPRSQNAVKLGVIPAFD
jgi:hypothetical protein